DPGQRGAQAGTGVLADAAEQVPVGRTGTRIPARGEGALAREALLVVRIVNALRVDPHQRGRRLRAEVLHLQQRPALLRQGQQGAALLLLDDVVGTKAVAHVPADDL